MPATPSITGVLKANGSPVANLTTTSYNSGTGILILTGTVSSNTTLTAGQALSLDVTTAQAGVTFQIRFDSQTYPSRIDIPTTTVISVDNQAVYDAPYPGGSTITSAFNGDLVYVRSTVSDPSDSMTSLPWI